MEFRSLTRVIMWERVLGCWFRYVRLKFVAIVYLIVSYLLKKPTLFKGLFFVTVSTYVGLSHDVTTLPLAPSPQMH